MNPMWRGVIYVVAAMTIASPPWLCGAAANVWFTGVVIAIVVAVLFRGRFGNPA